MLDQHLRDLFAVGIKSLVLVTVSEVQALNVVMFARLLHEGISLNLVIILSQ